MNERIAITLVNLFLAEIATLTGIQVYLKSPFAVFYNSDLLTMALLIVPLLVVVQKRNPFNFIYFTVLISLGLGNLLTDSKSFHSLLDSFYTFGYTSQAQNINSIFSLYSDVDIFSELLLITWFFVLSQIFWNLIDNAKGKDALIQGSYVSAITLALFLIYPPILSNIMLINYPLLLLGVGGILLMIAGSYLLSR